MWLVCTKSNVKRQKTFSLRQIAASVALVVMLLVQGEPANAKAIELGKHYHRVPMHVTNHDDVYQLKAETPDKVQVLEFFSYGCYWCSQLRPHLDKWAHNKPDFVTYKRLPVGGGRAWKMLSKAYYTAESLGKLEELDAKFFRAIHQQRVNLANLKILQGFFQDNGVAPEQFIKTFESFSVDRNVKRADEISIAYRVSATPMLVINGPNTSYTTDISMADGNKEFLLEIINYLVEKEKKYL